MYGVARVARSSTLTPQNEDKKIYCKTGILFPSANDSTITEFLPCDTILCNPDFPETLMIPSIFIYKVFRFANLHFLIE